MFNTITIEVLNSNYCGENRILFSFCLKALNPFLLLRGENSKALRFFLRALNLFYLRREQDSNLRTSFAGYTLSRRASSTTRAPLLRHLRLQR